MKYKNSSFSLLSPHFIRGNTLPVWFLYPLVEIHLITFAPGKRQHKQLCFYESRHYQLSKRASDHPVSQTADSNLAGVDSHVGSKYHRRHLCRPRRRSRRSCCREYRSTHLSTDSRTGTHDWIRMLDCIDYSPLISKTESSENQHYSSPRNKYPLYRRNRRCRIVVPHQDSPTVGYI